MGANALTAFLFSRGRKEGGESGANFSFRTTRTLLPSTSIKLYLDIGRGRRVADSLQRRVRRIDNIDVEMGKRSGDGRRGDCYLVRHNVLSYQINLSGMECPCGRKTCAAVEQLRLVVSPPGSLSW